MPTSQLLFSAKQTARGAPGEGGGGAQDGPARHQSQTFDAESPNRLKRKFFMSAWVRVRGGVVGVPTFNAECKTA